MKSIGAEPGNVLVGAVTASTLMALAALYALAAVADRSKRRR